MFREMRRKAQALTEATCMEILENSQNGVLALLGDDDYPYTVPLNHVCMNGRLYFHCAVEGHKVEAISGHDKASYCVIDADDVDGETLSTRFRSVIVFGRVRMVQDTALKRAALMAIGRRFAPANMEKAVEEINESLQRTGIIELSIEHISGKESRALAREQREREGAK